MPDIAHTLKVQLQGRTRLIVRGPHLLLMQDHEISGASIAAPDPLTVRHTRSWRVLGGL